MDHGQLIECEQCHAKTKVARLVRLRCVDTTEVCWILTALDALPDPLLGDDVSLAQALSDRYQTLTGWHRVFVCDECYRTLSLVEHTGCVLHQCASPSGVFVLGPYHKANHASKASSSSAAIF